MLFLATKHIVLGGQSKARLPLPQRFDTTKRIQETYLAFVDTSYLTQCDELGCNAMC